MKPDSQILDLALCRQLAANYPALPLLKAAQAVVGYFSRVKEVTGLTLNQYALLVAVALAGESTVNQLAANLALDQTTVSRNLIPLKKQLLIGSAPGKDRRTRIIALTPAGKMKLSQGLPYWQGDQQRFMERVGEAEWKELTDRLNQMRQSLAVG